MMSFDRPGYRKYTPSHFSTHKDLLLEELVEAKLPCALHRVPNESGKPAAHQPSQAVLPDRDAKPGPNAPVLGRVGLHVACKQQ